ncbi:hypothetical protein N477_20270 [Pseudoalteromonas luteoviolacea H33-S]|nr:hypothetical protein N477_20270 [Pseudoalteromonas luteoviolacea H33-S]
MRKHNKDNSIQNQVITNKNWLKINFQIITATTFVPLKSKKLTHKNQ